MATSEVSVSAEAHNVAASKSASKASTRKHKSILDRVLRLLSSVRFGITMLVILLICSMIGMLIMQVEVEGFQEYYQQLTPAQRAIYEHLGFFDIYHSWYFALLLAVTGLNIILASIDRFPTAWRYISKPALQASPNYIRAQMFNTEESISESPRALADRVREAWRARGFRARISEHEGRLTVFAERNTWNRLGAYVVHLALLIIFAAGFLTTLIIIRKPQYEFLGALSMPIVTVILTLAIFLGNDIRTLPPILDSYWRPIHVSIATVGYGVCLVSFGLAFAYVLKDGVRSEAVAIAVALFGLLVYGTIGRYGIPFHADYSAALFFEKSALPVRASLPGVGPLMFITLVALVVVLALFTVHMLKRDEKTRAWAWRLFRGAALLQGIVVLVLFFQIKTLDNAGSRIPEQEYPIFTKWMSEQARQSLTLEDAQRWVQQNSAILTVKTQSNPVEFGAVIGLFVLLLMVSIFAWKREEVVKAMPSLQAIDSLLYRTVGVAFPLLSLLLITGAVWANESWGRYWGWDSKETGALVAWIAYAAFLHTRIAHGWRGRRSAYFALLGFALVIFTWLGVSYLLPGLHSYA